MNSENTIFYKGTQINNMHDLKKFTSRKNSIKSGPLLHSILNCECILYQNIINQFYRPYTIQDMLFSQSYLENLNLLESIKYSGYIVNARQLLHKYLRLQYDFSACNLINEITKLCSKKDLISAHDFNSNTILLTLEDEKNRPSPSKSVRTYLNQYLFKQMSALNRIRYGIYPNMAPDHAKQIADTRLFLPAYKAPDFLLSFTFDDGRNFEHTCSQINPQKMPPFNPNTSCSEYSYQLVLNRIGDILTQEDNDDLYIVSALFRFDSIFLFYKLNALSRYYRLYLSDSFLDLMLRTYGFTYRQIIELESTIVNQIFKDEKFIITGLKSKYLDFMLPFDIIFQYTVHNPIPSSIPINSNQFETDLVKIKNMAMQFWKKEISFPCKFAFLDKENLSISTNEETLSTNLRKNPFYKNYYDNSSEFFTNFSPEKNVPFLCFGIIKNAIQI